MNADSLKSMADDITSNEVKKALFAMKPWKAPGPYGFPVGFYQKDRETVRRSVCDFVQHVWRNPSAVSDVNKTDIYLILKVNQPQLVNQFRPICLCNTIYKIITKVIVERLKPHMSFLISSFQTGFVPGRSIHENIIIATEVLHNMTKKKGNKGYFAIKIDPAKAYDRINWEFIWRVLVEIGLPENLINIIMHGVTSVETNINWNGRRSEFFCQNRGIRQEDPISPYLFVLCMDKLSHIIEQEVHQKNWKGVQLALRQK